MTQAQIDAKRAAYLANLKLEIALDDRNLQALKQSITPISDMRTLAEKLQDVEKLKTQVRQQLLTITDPANATAILSSLNVAEVQFVAQKFNLLAAEIKPKFALGINALQFRLFLDSYARQEAAAPVAGRAIGVEDLRGIVAGLATRGQVAAVLAAVQHAGIQADILADIIAALNGMHRAAPAAPMPAGEAYDMDADVVHEAAGLPATAFTWAGLMSDARCLSFMICF